VSELPTTVTPKVVHLGLKAVDVEYRSPPDQRTTSPPVLADDAADRVKRAVSNAFEHQRDAMANADIHTHKCDGLAAVNQVQVLDGSYNNARRQVVRTRARGGGGGLLAAAASDLKCKR